MNTSIFAIIIVVIIVIIILEHCYKDKNLSGEDYLLSINRYIQ